MLMKKVLLAMFMSVTTMVAMAQTNKYTDMLNVIMEGEPAGSQIATIYVEENTDGTYKLSLNNFVLGSGEEAMAVGNIVVDNIATTEVDGVKTFNTSQNILISEGDASQDLWIGPFLEGSNKHREHRCRKQRNCNLRHHRPSRKRDYQCRYLHRQRQEGICKIIQL